MLTIDYSLLALRSGEKVLDIGCGEGRHSWEACKQGECIICALDLNRDSLRKGYGVFRRLEDQGESRGVWLLAQADILRLPFRDGTFDKVVCSEVLEHIPDDLHAMREITRVLKDDGILAVSVPSYLPEAICWKLSRSYRTSPGGHVRIYRARELKDKLSQNNLEIFAVRHKHALHSFYWISRCLFGADNDKALIPSLYHKFLVWDLKTRTVPVRLLDDALNTIFAKSIVFYARKRGNGNTAG